LHRNQSGASLSYWKLADLGVLCCKPINELLGGGLKRRRVVRLAWDVPCALGHLAFRFPVDAAPELHASAAIRESIVVNSYGLSHSCGAVG
jgi:hypothetical protein